MICHCLSIETLEWLEKCYLAGWLSDTELASFQHKFSEYRVIRGQVVYLLGAKKDSFGGRFQNLWLKEDLMPKLPQIWRCELRGSYINTTAIGDKVLLKGTLSAVLPSHINPGKLFVFEPSLLVETLKITSKAKTNKQEPAP